MQYPEHIPQSTELHEERSRGWYIPEEVRATYEARPRLLNGEEVLLLMKLNGLCHPEKGCWASNRWLANWWDKSLGWVSKAIARFHVLGLITIQFKPGGRRIIRTTFQGDGIVKRTTPCRKVLPLQKSARPLVEKCKAPSRKVQGVLTSINNEEKNNCRTASPSLGVNEFVPSKLTTRFVKFSIRKRLHLLQRGSTKTGWSPATIKTWDRCLRQLTQEIPRPEVKQVMLWYFEHYGDQYVPQCRTLKKFCERFTDIKAAMQRTNKANGIPQGRLQRKKEWHNGKLLEVNEWVEG